MFASGLSVLYHVDHDFDGIPSSGLALIEMGLRVYPILHYYSIETGDPQMLVFIFVFLVLVIVFLFNMLTAQLSCQYAAVHKNMVGYARLDRIGIIVNTMPMVSKRRWEVFSGSSASTWVNPVSPRRSAFGSYRIAATLGTPVLGPSRKSMFRRWSCYQFLCGHNCARSSSSPSCRSTRRSLSSPVGTAFHAVAL